MKKMKKILAILLASLLMLTLFAACNGGSDPDPGPAPAPAPGTNSPGQPSGSGGGDRTFLPPTPRVASGFFDVDYDYFANPRLKVAYLVLQSGVLYEMGADAMRIWADRMNIEFNMFDANGDNDLYLSTIRTLASQGYDGIITDPDVTIYERIKEVAEEEGIAWHASMAPPRGADDRLLAPAAGFDFYYMGEEITQFVIDYADDNWRQARPEEMGMIGVDFSSSFAITRRIDAARDMWNAKYPGYEGNFFVADTIVGSMNATTAYEQVGAILATQPQIRYWLIVAATDDLADGAASAAMDAGLGDTTVISCGGGPSLILQWDAGEVTPWKAAVFTAPILAVEPHMGAMYAYVAGWQTHSSIWPDWFDHSADDEYSFLINTSYTLTLENYKHYLSWVDLFVGMDIYGYGEPAQLDDFVVRGNPPAHYAG